MMKILQAWIGALVVLTAAFPANASEVWNGYLDYAYVYSSADHAELRGRLDGYAGLAGIALDDFRAERLESSGGRLGERLGEANQRRLAIANLLGYLASDDPARLAAAGTVIDGLSDRLARHENRYWYHYIQAHRALQLSDSRAFNREVFNLWFHVVVPLEASYDTHQALSLDRTAQEGFVAALPYLYENIARLVLLRSQEMGLQKGLDPLAAIVRFLHDDRIGAYPETVPPEASSRELIEQIISRLDGPESDGGSLTFTLALYRASNLHNEAAAMLADDGLTPATQEMIRVAIGAYRTALRRADTLQGQTAVYTRVLRQLGEVYSAKQRLGADPEIDVPFSIDRAIDIYAELDANRIEGWERQGFRDHGRDEYLMAMRRLWEEIQEAGFNAAEYHLSKWDANGRVSDVDLGDAVGHYSQYLAFFDRFAAAGTSEGVPESAFFSAYWAGRGIGDAQLNSSSGSPSLAQLANATERYRTALEMFPFETRVWSTLAESLERQGREDEFLSVTQSIVEDVGRSQALAGWIELGRDESSSLDAMRRALADDLAVMYLGFSGEESMDELEQGLFDLIAEGERLAQSCAALEERLADLAAQREEKLASAAETDAALPAVSAAPPFWKPDAVGEEIVRKSARLRESEAARERVRLKVMARGRALPLFKAVLETAGLSRSLSVRRDHPVHVLLRRMNFEDR